MNIEHSEVPMDWQALRAEQLAQLKSDAARYGFPEDILGRRFDFHHPLGITSGSITGYVFGESGVPALQVSNPTFRGWALEFFYPTGEEDIWMMRVKSANGKGDHEDMKGFMHFY